MTSQNNDGNPFLSFLEDEPRTAFFSRQDDFTRQGSSLDRRAFSGLYDDAVNQYFGSVGDQIRSNQTPDLTFNSFLDNFPFLARLGQARRSQTRSVTPGLVGSQTRFHLQPSIL